MKGSSAERARHIPRRGKRRADAAQELRTAVNAVRGRVRERASGGGGERRLGRARPAERARGAERGCSLRFARVPLVREIGVGRARPCGGERWLWGDRGVFRVPELCATRGRDRIEMREGAGGADIIWGARGVLRAAPPHTAHTRRAPPPHLDLGPAQTRRSSRAAAPKLPWCMENAQNEPRRDITIGIPIHINGKQSPDHPIYKIGRNPLAVSRTRVNPSLVLVDWHDWCASGAPWRVSLLVRPKTLLYFTYLYS